jgi:hypothetical protein
MVGSDWTARRCKCVAIHCPASYTTITHHILPKSWGGQDVPENKVEVCANTHDSIHEILNQYVHLGGKPPETWLQHYNAMARRLAADAWARRPSDKPPYTTAAGTTSAP